MNHNYKIKVIKAFDENNKEIIKDRRYELMKTYPDGGDDWFCCSIKQSEMDFLREYLLDREEALPETYIEPLEGMDITRKLKIDHE